MTKHFEDLHTASSDSETLPDQAARRAYVRDWIARNQRKLAAGIGGSVLVLPLLAQAQTAQDMVAAESLDGVTSVELMEDGGLRMTLDNGRVIQVGAAEVQTAADGTIMISNAAAEAVAEIAALEPVAVDGMGAGAAGAALAAGAAAAIALDSSSDAAEPAPAPEPEPDPLNRETLGNDLELREVFDDFDADAESRVFVSFGDDDDAQEFEAERDDDGNWFLPGLSDEDLDALPQGDQSVNVRVEDADGEEEDSDSVERMIDTIAPEVSIDTPIAGDDVLNAAEQGDDLVIEGTTDAEDGQEVTVTLNGVEYTAVVADGAWSVTVPAGDLAALDDDSSYDITADVEDAAGNPAAQASASFATDFTAEISIDQIADGELTSLDTFSDLEITGGTEGVEAGREVTVQFGDLTATGDVQEDGTWSVMIDSAHLQALDEDLAEIDVSASVSDEAGNTALAELSLDADLAELPFMITAPADGANLDSFDLDNGVLTVEGVAAPGAEVAVSVNGDVETAEADADGNWSADFEPNDGDRTIEASATLDGADLGTLTSSFTLDTEPGIALDAPEDGVALGLEAAEDDGLAVSGTTANIPDGREVTVELRDTDGNVQASLTAEVAGNAFAGDFDPADIDGLADESDFTLNASVSPADGEPAVEASGDLSTDFRPLISLDEFETGDVLILNELDSDDAVIDGTTRGVEEGQMVTIEITGDDGSTIGSGQAAVQADGSFSFDVPADFIDALEAGVTYTASADVENAAGRAAETATQSAVAYLPAPNFLTTGQVDGATIGAELFLDPRTELPADGGVSLGETLSFDTDVISYVEGSSGTGSGLTILANEAGADQGEVVFGAIGFLSGAFDPAETPLLTFEMEIVDSGQVAQLDVMTTEGGDYTSFIGTQDGDSIDALSGVDNVIRGRGGDDEIDVSASGVNTVIFEPTAQANGDDNITGFDLGGLLPDRFGFAGLDNEDLRGSGSEFQVVDAGDGIGGNTGLVVFSTALDSDADALAALGDLGLDADDSVFALLSDGTDAGLIRVNADADGNVDEDQIEDLAQFEGLNDLSGFSADNILGFEAHTT